MFTNIIHRIILAGFLCLYSCLSLALVEVVEQDEIDRYMLDFTDSDPNPYRLVVGSNGALYLRDNSDGSHEKISQCLNGSPAQIVSGGGFGTFFQADDNFENIVYVSAESCISQGDSGNNEDVFVYNRATSKTLRVTGNKPHEGSVYQVRISPDGSMVAFGSKDGSFGDTSNITLPLGVPSISETDATILYLYGITDFNANQGDLFTPSYELNSSGLDEGLGIHGCGQQCQFTDHNTIVLYWKTYYTAAEVTQYNIASDSLDILSYLCFDCYGGTSFHMLADRRHLIRSDDFTDYSGSGFISNNVSVYDTLTKDGINFVDDVPNIIHNGVPFGKSTIESFTASGLFRSPLERSRYVAFYTFTDGIFPVANDEHLPYNTGSIYVYDSVTREFRRAFSVDRKARSYGIYNGGYPLKSTCINCDGIEDFDLAPSDVRFHNNDQYITFEANSWYLDPTIPYNDFSIPYARDVFVVANPFTSGINVDGAPTINFATDQGWFIWRDNGVWKSRFAAGGTGLRFVGSLKSTESMNNLQPVSIEASDVLELDPDTMLNFNLYVAGPYRDGFNINISDTSTTCVNMSSPSGANIYLGPDRILMPDSFDLKTFSDCEVSPDIETIGRPSINRTTDNGIFIWENSGNNWQAEIVSGDKRRTVQIDVSSQQQLNNVEQINIESNDVFIIMLTSLDLSLRVRSPWYDGFKFTDQAQSDTCISTANLDMPIYLGPNRVDMGNSLNLDTQMNCP